MTFYLFNTETQEYAAHDSEGEHDGKTVLTLENARQFPSWRSASEFNQNFGPAFVVTEF